MLILSKYNQYIKNSGLYLFSTIIVSAVQIVVNPFFALNLSPEDYATVGYYQGFSMLFTPLIGFFIIDFYLRKFYTLNQTELKEVKANMVKLLVYFSAIISILCLMGLYIYVRLTNVSIAFFPYAVLTVAQIYLSMILSFQLAEYRIAGKANKFAGFTIISGLITVGLSLLLVVIFKWGAIGKLLGAFLTSLLFFIYLIFRYRSLWIYDINKELLKELVKYSVPLVLAGMLGFFSSGYDKVLLERTGDIHTMGIYCVGAQIAGYLNIFASAIKSTFQPDIYKALSEKNLPRVCKVMLAIIGLVALLVFLFIIICPIAIKLLTANRYVESTPFAKIVALSVVTSTIYYQVSQITYGSGLSNITLVNKIIGTILTIALFAVLIPKYGAFGAAWCTVTSYLIYATSNIVLLWFNRNSFLK